MTKREKIQVLVDKANCELGGKMSSNCIRFVSMGSYYFLAYWGFEKKTFSNATSIEHVEKWLNNYVMVCRNNRNGSLVV